MTPTQPGYRSEAKAEAPEVKLQVLVCTIGREGMERFLATDRPQVEGVQYLVSWQQPDPTLEIPARSDITVITSDTSGLSVNRNLAMEAATAPYCLIGDDDVAYSASGLAELMYAFDTRPDLDVAALRYTCNGRYIKPYSENPFNLNWPVKGWYPTSFELAYRRESPAGRIRFNERLGLGAEHLKAGEEDVWLFDALQLGTRVAMRKRDDNAHQALFLPITIGAHDHPTTAERHAAEPWLAETHGAVMSHIHPGDWRLRCLVHGWRSPHFSTLRYMRLCLQGAKYARKHKIFK